MSAHALAHLPRTTAALRAVRERKTVRVSPWQRLFRRLWALAEHVSAIRSTCDECSAPMLEHTLVGSRQLCIRCACAYGASLSAPELAGAAAVIRTLLRDAQLDWCRRQSHPFDDLRRNEAILDTVQGVLWWMTPPNVRTPNVVAIQEDAIVELLHRFDRVWSLRSTHESLRTVYGRWRQAQAKALQHAELEALDRKYARFVGSDPP